MSYILDALRRAEAQRERGGVPDIHALPQATGGSLAAPSRAGSPIVWGVIATLVIAALVLAWWLTGLQEAPRNVVVMAPAPTPMQPPAALPAPAQAVAPVPAPVPTPVPPPAVVAAPQLTLPLPTPATAVAPPPASIAPAKPVIKETGAAGPAQRPAPAATPAPTPAATPKPAPVAQPVPVPAVNEPRIYTRDELPSDIRAQLPQIKIGGSSYSESPSSRMLIANGQVFYENEKIAPDTTLVQIRPNSAVLSFRGFRYVMPF